MDPNSSPWSYAYNRIVPGSTGSTGSTAEEFQHPHLATITAASLASFNAAAASGGSFVPPSPIGSYNPVFQQIYHHAAAASVQPKPAHYASSTVNTPHRQLQQLQLPTLDKQLSSFQNQAAVAAVSSAAAAAAAVNNVASNYYGENSSSSGASPSPTTVALTSTSLTWNTPNMISNTFLAMQQQQQQAQQQQQQQQQAQQQLNLVADKVVSIKSNCCNNI